MVEFKKKVSKVLFYNRKEYNKYLRGNVRFISKWFGVSFQLNHNEVDTTEFLRIFLPLFEKVVEKIDVGNSWVVNHDYPFHVWFPNTENTLPSLRTLFKLHGIPNSYTGAVVFTRDELLKFAQDTILYPTKMFKEERSLYTDLDISSAHIAFVIKVSHHSCIDFLSTDEKILKEIVEENRSDLFDIKVYRGTTL
ncbi:hypothetical protein [Polluticoccus soli]|uniref:hypothetical protein n=1 Tax=Polluticoccus soli TaxID=3034150 RepID=UPI0023E199E7|nr:hypothetical protein [Flavipsychrobacter sp. JY13-12]